MYNHSTCDIITCGATSFINRINLERGCFLKPMESSCPNLNVTFFFPCSSKKVCGINPVHGLYGFGGEDGIAEFWDPRTRKPVGFLDLAAHVQDLTRGYTSYF